MAGDEPTGFIHQATPLCATLDIRALNLTAEEVILALHWARELSPHSWWGNRRTTLSRRRFPNSECLVSRGACAWVARMRFG